jgi:hypothetical protein
MVCVFSVGVFRHVLVHCISLPLLLDRQRKK